MFTHPPQVYNNNNSNIMSSIIPSPAVDEETRPGPRPGKWCGGDIHVQAVLVIAGAVPLEVGDVQKAERRGGVFSESTAGA